MIVWFIWVFFNFAIIEAKKNNCRSCCNNWQIISKKKKTGL